MKNNDNTLDDEDGGSITNYGTIEYDELNIPITVGNLRMGGRHVVFGFYRQLARPSKQGSKKLEIICVLCDKALDGKHYDQWKWVKCARVITKNTTNMICHL